MNQKEDVWSISKIFIRIITYPFCALFLFGGIFTIYITIVEETSNEQKMYGFGLAIIILSLVLTYLYYDLREILGFKKEEIIERADILDDNFN